MTSERYPFGDAVFVMKVITVPESCVVTLNRTQKTSMCHVEQPRVAESTSTVPSWQARLERSDMFQSEDYDVVLLVLVVYSAVIRLTISNQCSKTTKFRMGCIHLSWLATDESSLYDGTI